MITRRLALAIYSFAMAVGCIPASGQIATDLRVTLGTNVPSLIGNPLVVYTGTANSTGITLQSAGTPSAASLIDFVQEDGNSPSYFGIRAFSDNYSTMKSDFHSDQAGFYMVNLDARPMFFRTNNLDRLTILEDGQIKIGTDAPVRTMVISGQSAGIELKGTAQSELGWFNPAGQGVWFLTRRDDLSGVNDDLKLLRYNNGIHAGTVLQVSEATGNIGIGTSAPAARLHVVGSTRTSTLEVTGGSDLAEPFAGPEERIEPGTVVCIDTDNPGRVRASAAAYDTTVCGVISGAGGVNPGMLMSQEGRLGGDHPVALVGRVYVRCDASAGPIKTGDLLTTSDTAGHAMKATDRLQAVGAIIGKALGPLEKGQGLVLCVLAFH